MGNITTKDIGNFQQNVGKTSSDIGVFSSTIFGGILIVIGVILAIIAFIPYNDDINKSCGGIDSDNTCFSSGGYCDVNTKKCIVKRKRYYLIIPAVFLILISVLIIYSSKIWQKEVYSNKEVAELGGTMEEINLVKKLFNN